MVFSSVILWKKQLWSPRSIYKNNLERQLWKWKTLWPWAKAAVQNILPCNYTNSEVQSPAWAQEEQLTASIMQLLRNVWAIPTLDTLPVYGQLMWRVLLCSFLALKQWGSRWAEEKGQNCLPQVHQQLLHKRQKPSASLEHRASTGYHMQVMEVKTHSRWIQKGGEES